MGLHDVAERFRRTLSRLGELDPGKCWPWPGTRGLNGYGVLRRKLKKVYAHRVAYELVHGPIPERLVIDHICRNRACCNPAHLEAVTVRENTLRGAGITAQLHHQGTCIRGHEISGDNVYMRPHPSGEYRPRCRTCTLMWNAAWRARRAARRDAVRLLDKPRQVEDGAKARIG